MNNRLVGTGIGLAIAAVVGTVASILCFDFVRVPGNELGVMETWNGVSKNIVPPSTRIIFSPTTSMYMYEMSSQVFVMNDADSAKESGRGRDADAYLVQSKDQQDMHISLNVRWKLDPAKVINIHQVYHAHKHAKDVNIIEERLIRPTVMLIVKNHATKMNAVEAYSGEGLVKLQNEIEQDLTNPDSELRKEGVIVENFVIEKIVLDVKYTDEIKARQIAQQRLLRSVEETKAAEAEALKVKAEAQADLNRRVVEAERDKKVALLKAEQDAGAQITQAKADAERITIAANAEKAAAEARAAAITAIGEAEANKQKFLFAAFGTAGADNYVRIQIANSMATAFSGIKGYLPSDMKINLLTDNYNDAIMKMMVPHTISPAGK